MSAFAAFARALLDPEAPVPPGLVAWNGSDPALRFAVYRNNVVHSLVTVLGDSFPVVRDMAGEAFFGALAQHFVVDHPPRSPLMHRYGEAFPDWLAGFGPAADWPFLPDLARLELARLHAWQAADSPAIDPAQLAAVLAEPARLAGTVLRLAPALTALVSSHPVVTLWQAHPQGPAERAALLATLESARAESALIFRRDDEVLVLPAPAADAALAAALAAGRPLGPALAAHPQADLARLLGTLLRQGLVVQVLAPDGSPQAWSPA